jgi:hypothetical protein
VVQAQFASQTGSVDVSDFDGSNYFGWVSGIDVEKATNGEDADTAPGPTVATGSTVTWTFTVSTSGNVPVDNVGRR